MLAARRQFGNTALLEEDRRNIQMFPPSSPSRDLTYAFRMLRKNRGRAAAVVTLALGSAEYSHLHICNAVLFNRFPMPSESNVNAVERQPDGTLGSVAAANFVDWRNGEPVVQWMAAAREASFASSSFSAAKASVALSGGTCRRVSFRIGAGSCCRNFFRKRIGPARIASAI